MSEFINESSLRKIVVAETTDGGVYVIGEIISYCSAPSVGIQRADGTVKDWRADLCSVATEKQARQYHRDCVDYWRRRAEKAEREIKKFTACESTRQP